MLPNLSSIPVRALKVGVSRFTRDDNQHNNNNNSAFPQNEPPPGGFGGFGSPSEAVVRPAPRPTYPNLPGLREMPTSAIMNPTDSNLTVPYWGLFNLMSTPTDVQQRAAYNEINRLMNPATMSSWFALPTHEEDIYNARVQELRSFLQQMFNGQLRSQVMLMLIRNMHDYVEHAASIRNIRNMFTQIITVRDTLSTQGGLRYNHQARDWARV